MQSYDRLGMHIEHFFQWIFVKDKILAIQSVFRYGAIIGIRKVHKLQC